MRGAAPTPAYAVVVPSIGRPSLHELLAGLAAQQPPRPVEVVVVDDRPGRPDPIEVAPDVAAVLSVRVLRGHGRGPAAARNLGWRVTAAPWVAFLDDDVRLVDGWSVALVQDLIACEQDTAGTQGRLDVPLPADRRPTDWERATSGLERARWPTADMAYRREALESVHGFDERFPRAYREDADLALRVRKAGWRLEQGRRRTVHPVRSAPADMSLRVQRGNADDALMRRLHGVRWRERAETGRGRLPWHAATVLAGALGVAAAAAAVPPWRGARAARLLAALGGSAWTLLTLEFAARRIAPGPRDAAEVRRMLWTSAAIPPAALRHRVAGEWRHRAGAWPWPPPLRAVLFDRDGTLVHDVPYNDDPALVKPVDGAREALDRLRAAGIRVGVVTNQSGIGRGLLASDRVAAVNAAIEERLGPFDVWQVCPHAPEAGCECRKPRPAMVHRAAHALGVAPYECALVGDIGADVEAARAAGARGVLVPNEATRPEEVADAPEVAATLEDAVALLLRQSGRGHG